ncbi:MAG: hypothetical protein WC763_06210 [Candidatus Paceibacterota bacterium]|jgi:hypothetical protein
MACHDPIVNEVVNDPGFVIHVIHGVDCRARETLVNVFVDWLTKHHGVRSIPPAVCCEMNGAESLSDISRIAKALPAGTPWIGRIFSSPSSYSSPPFALSLDGDKSSALIHEYLESELHALPPSSPSPSHPPSFGGSDFSNDYRGSNVLLLADVHEHTAKCSPRLYRSNTQVTRHHSDIIGIYALTNVMRLKLMDHPELNRRWRMVLSNNDNIFAQIIAASTPPLVIGAALAATTTTAAAPPPTESGVAVPVIAIAGDNPTPMLPLNNHHQQPATAAAAWQSIARVERRIQLLDGECVLMGEGATDEEAKRKALEAAAPRLLEHAIRSMEAIERAQREMDSLLILLQTTQRDLFDSLKEARELTLRCESITKRLADAERQPKSVER